MLSIGEIAARDRVSKPGVSRRVSQLRLRGLEVEIDTQGRVAKVNSVQYDELRQRFADPSKAQAPKPPDQPLNPLISESYEEALRRKTWADATRAELRLREEQGQVVHTDKLADALAQCGERIVRAVDRLMAAVDDMAVAVAKDGVAGLRGEMKKLVHRTRSDIADALADIAAAAPETEPDEPA